MRWVIANHEASTVVLLLATSLLAGLTAMTAPLPGTWMVITILLLGSGLFTALYNQLCGRVFANQQARRFSFGIVLLMFSVTVLAFFNNTGYLVGEYAALFPAMVGAKICFELDVVHP